MKHRQCVSIHPYASFLSICLSVCLSIHLSIYLSISICLSLHDFEVLALLRDRAASPPHQQSPRPTPKQATTSKQCISQKQFKYHILPLTLFATHAHLAILGIEATACVALLDRIIRRPPARGALFTWSGERRKSSIRANDTLARSGRANNNPARSGHANDKLAHSGRAL